MHGRGVPHDYLKEIFCIGVLGRNISHSSPWCIFRYVGLSSTWICPSSLVKLEAFVCCPQQKTNSKSRQSSFLHRETAVISSSATFSCHKVPKREHVMRRQVRHDWRFSGSWGPGRGNKRWTKRPPAVPQIVANSRKNCQNPDFSSKIEEIQHFSSQILFRNTLKCRAIFLNSTDLNVCRMYVECMSNQIHHIHQDSAITKLSSDWCDLLYPMTSRGDEAILQRANDLQPGPHLLAVEWWIPPNYCHLNRKMMIKNDHWW